MQSADCPLKGSRRFTVTCGGDRRVCKNIHIISYTIYPIFPQVCSLSESNSWGSETLIELSVIFPYPSSLIFWCFLALQKAWKETPWYQRYPNHFSWISLMIQDSRERKWHFPKNKRHPTLHLGREAPKANELVFRMDRQLCSLA